MNTITLRHRRRVTAVAHELIAIADDLRADQPALADTYAALGRAIEGSHYCAERYGGDHSFQIDVPKRCTLDVSKRSADSDRPATVNLSVPHQSGSQRAAKAAMHPRLPHRT